MTVTLDQFEKMEFKNKWLIVSALQEELRARDEAYLILEAEHAIETERSLKLESALTQMRDRFLTRPVAVENLLLEHDLCFRDGSLTRE